MASKSGRAHTSCLVRHLAHCCRGESKFNLIVGVEAGDPRLPLGVDGNIHRPRRWIHVLQVDCNQYIFGYLCDTIYSDTEENPTLGDELRCFFGGNFSLHKTDYVTHVIDGRNNNAHKSIYVDWPPYRPNLAPIEYVFYKVVAELARRVKRDWTTTLCTYMYDVCSSIGNGGKFHLTFVHCGYPYT